jgi:hypothetical protein
MFQLTLEEHEFLRCQFGILKPGSGRHRKYLPLVFTEQGVAMLSGILNSDRAIRVNIAVMRTFIKLRQLLHQEALSDRIMELEKGSDKLFRIVFERLDTWLLEAPETRVSEIVHYRIQKFTLDKLVAYLQVIKPMLTFRVA